MEGMEWLRKNTKEDSVVFSNFQVGNLLFAFANRPVYLGHPHITVNFEEKMKKMEEFLKEGKEEFLKNEKIEYIFLIEEERGLKFILEKKEYLEKVFENEKVTIFRVNI